jgi:N-acetylmuramoyl-L-alanine amidase
MHQSNSALRQQTPSGLRQLIGRNMPIVTFIAVAAIGMLLVYWYFSPNQSSVESVAAAGIGVRDPTELSAPIHKERIRPPVSQRLSQSPGPIRVGLIAGHAGNDSGAVCGDGLTEAQINAAVAAQVARQLEAAGITVQILDEFDRRLDGYSATALISIHADSCDYINDLATGFKISGSPLTDSSALSICMEQAYGQATGLPYHPNSITPDMDNYHAFRKISAGTPALIIEVGFMNLDREILTTGSSQVTKGLIDGILCFLNKAP